MFTKFCRIWGVNLSDRVVFRVLMKEWGVLRKGYSLKWKGSTVSSNCLGLLGTMWGEEGLVLTLFLS